MLTLWNDFDRTLSALDHLFPRFDARVLHPARFTTRAWPRVNVKDTGAALVLTAEVPGLSAKDLELTLESDQLTIKGSRAAAADNGETTAYELVRTFTLPADIDANAIVATVKDGILTVTLDKAPEAKPRQIPVKAA
jgi:HSP20 family protein